MNFNKEIIEDILKEEKRAVNLYGPFNSLHEAYAVILEEMDEFWDYVKEKQVGRVGILSECL
jgi:hypothetical protein